MSVTLILVAGLLSVDLPIYPMPPARASEETCPFRVELPSQVTLVVVGEHDDLILWGVCRAVVDIETMAQEHGLSLPAATLYVVDTPAAARRRGSIPGRTWGRDLQGAAFGTVAIVLTGHMPMGWWGGSFVIAAHELVHVLQHPMNEAQWLAEGAAEYIAGQRHRAIAGNPYRSDPAVLAGFRSSATVDLRRLESRGEFNRSVQHGSYMLASAAFELLLSETEHGLDDYLSCFVPEKKRTVWRTAFSMCFGLTVAEFYALFDEWREAGFLEFPRDRRERERLEFDHAIEQCLLGALRIGGTLTRANC